MFWSFFNVPKNEGSRAKIMQNIEHSAHYEESYMQLLMVTFFDINVTSKLAFLHFFSFYYENFQKNKGHFNGTLFDFKATLCHYKTLVIVKRTSRVFET